MPALADAGRLDLLERSGLLTKSVGDRLEHLCYTATQVIDADCSEINAVTASEQVHVARYPDPQLLAWSSDPVEDSACQLVVTRDQVLDISDSPNHPLCGGMPWTDLYRGYLGAPIHYRGAVLGSLCVLTFGERQWSPSDRLAITALADLVSASIEDDHFTPGG